MALPDDYIAALETLARVFASYRHRTGAVAVLVRGRGDRDLHGRSNRVTSTSWPPQMTRSTPPSLNTGFEGKKVGAGSCGAFIIPLRRIRDDGGDPALIGL